MQILPTNSLALYLKYEGVISFPPQALSTCKKFGKTCGAGTIFAQEQLVMLPRGGL
jgi:uncharacterized membrane protein (DUF485 family)